MSFLLSFIVLSIKAEEAEAKMPRAFASKSGCGNAKTAASAHRYLNER